MTSPTIDSPQFVEEDDFTGMIVDDTGTIAAREYHTDHVTADGTKQRALTSTVTEEAYRGQGLAGKIVRLALERGEIHLLLHLAEHLQWPSRARPAPNSYSVSERQEEKAPRRCLGALGRPVAKESALPPNFARTSRCGPSWLPRMGGRAWRVPRATRPRLLARREQRVSGGGSGRMRWFACAAGLSPSPARSAGVRLRPGCSLHSRTKRGSPLRTAAALQPCATAHILTLAAGQKHVNTPLPLLANLNRA